MILHDPAFYFEPLLKRSNDFIFQLTTETFGTEEKAQEVEVSLSFWNI